MLRLSSESPADGEPEGGTLLEERNRAANRADGVEEGRVVRKIGTVGYDGSLQIALKNARIVGPVQTERGVDHGHQNLQFDAGGRAYFLSAGRDVSASAEVGLRELAVQLIDAPGIQV